MYDPRPPSLRVVNPQNSEQLRLCLLQIDHSCGLLQQLIPSEVYSKHDHTYCLVDPERLNNSPPVNDPVVANSRPAITAEQRLSVLLQLTVSAAEHLEIETSS